MLVLAALGAFVLVDVNRQHLRLLEQVVEECSEVVRALRLSQPVDDIIPVLLSLGHVVVAKPLQSLNVTKVVREATIVVFFELLADHEQNLPALE